MSENKTSEFRLTAPDFKKPHIVLGTYYMVPALPRELFKVLAEMIEAATNRPVVLMHEDRPNRPLAQEVIDIVVMPAFETWNDGVLLPASFVFDHPLNKTNKADVYVDIVVPKIRSEHIKSILDLRGRRCVIPNRQCDELLFNHLHSKGKNNLFFGNIFENKSQYHVLEMILNNQADVGVVESPVIRCRKDETLNVKSLETLGPFPPYRIMVKNTIADELKDKLATYLLNVSKYDKLVERLSPYGVTGFAENSEEKYQRYRDMATKEFRLTAPDFKKPHIVLGTYYMVPALPKELFEVLAEMIEDATNRPVVLMHKERINRSLAQEVIDIVVMPANKTNRIWKDNVLLPASFVFDHPLNKTNKADVYVDIVVPKNRSEHIKSILDLRGRRCVIPNRQCDELLFNHLHSKGENNLFFGNIFENKSQYHVLEMILNNQADVGVVESPVIRCRKDETLNVKSLETLGALPPYRIMVKNTIADDLKDKLATYLLNVSKYDKLMKRLSPYGVTGFAENSEENYHSEYREI